MGFSFLSSTRWSFACRFAQSKVFRIDNLRMPRLMDGEPNPATTPPNPPSQSAEASLTFQHQVDLGTIGVGAADQVHTGSKACKIYEPPSYNSCPKSIVGVRLGNNVPVWPSARPKNRFTPPCRTSPTKHDRSYRCGPARE